jgi:hypothetical protein
LVPSRAARRPACTWVREAFANQRFCTVAEVFPSEKHFQRYGARSGVPGSEIGPFGFGSASLESKKFQAIYCLRSEERGPVMDTVLSLLISAGIIAFGAWVVVSTMAAGWAWPLMGLLAVLVGLLSLYGSVRDARAP